MAVHAGRAKQEERGCRCEARWLGDNGVVAAPKRGSDGVIVRESNRMMMCCRKCLRICDMEGSYLQDYNFSL